MNQTKMTVGVAVEPELLASWALTMESRLSCLTRIGHHEALNDRHGHRLVCEARLSPSRMPMTNEQVLQASSVVL